MSDIARLKNQGRQHEGREEWSKAIEAYVQAIRLADRGGVEADLSLYNRVGDLYQKVGQTQQAVDSWDKGVDAYMDAGFYNNAIALCNKILRTVPSRNSVYLKLGQISARKGFLSDARKNILEYAQRMQRAGQLDEAFRALAKFADLQPEPEIRLMLADQLLAHQRVSAGVDQLRFAWRDLVAQGRQSDADDVRARILELAPDRDPTVHRPEGESRTADSGELDAEGIIDLPELEPEEPRAPAASRAAPEPETSGVDLEEIELEPGPAPGRAEPEAAEADIEPEAMEIEGLEATSAADESALEEEELSVSPAADVEPAETEIEPLDLDSSTFEFDTSAGEGVALGSSGLGEFGVEEEEGVEEEGGATIEAPEGLTFDVGAFDFDFSAATEESGAAGADVSGLDLEGGSGAATDEPALEALEAVPVVPPQEVDLPPERPRPGRRPAESADEYREQLQEDPDNHDLRVRLAELLLEEGRRPEALRELRRALEGYESQSKIREAEFVADELLRLSPNDVRVHQKRVELAFLQQERGRLIQAYLDLADCLDRTDASEKAAAVYERVLELDPGNERARRALESIGPEGESAEEEGAAVGVSEGSADFVDLGSLLAAEEKPKSTRFKVRVTEPGAEEEFDFAEMLAQFRAKVAEAVTPEDYASHYDLGIAYQEMGLVDEAIAEFQIAARADSHRLQAHEMLGRCFLEKGEFKVAQKILLRALQIGQDEEKLVAVNYDLGRVHEALGEPGRALEFYERALGVDIGFRDVASRIRALRKKA